MVVYGIHELGTPNGETPPSQATECPRMQVVNGMAVNKEEIGVATEVRNHM